MENKSKDLISIKKEILIQLGESISKHIADLSADLEKYNDLEEISDAIDKLFAETECRAADNANLIQKLEKEIKEKDERIEELGKYEDFKFESTKLAALLIQVNGQQEELTARKTEYEEKIEAAEEKAADYKGRLDSKQEDYNRLYRRYNEELTKNREEIQKLKSDKEKLEEKIKELKAAVDEKKQKIDEITDELGTKKEKIEQLTRYVRELSEKKDEKISGLQDDIKWLTGYAKATDKKVVEALRGNPDELRDHGSWLVNSGKDDKYSRLLGETYGSVDRDRPKENTAITDSRKNTNSGFDDPA